MPFLYLHILYIHFPSTYAISIYLDYLGAISLSDRKNETHNYSITTICMRWMR